MYRNSEGYYDPTAGAAIERIMAGTRKPKRNSGKHRKRKRPGNANTMKKPLKGGDKQ